MGPELRKAAGPEEGMEYLHGVMMHGDKEPGLKHTVNSYLQALQYFKYM